MSQASRELKCPVDQSSLAELVFGPPGNGSGLCPVLNHALCGAYTEGTPSSRPGPVKLVLVLLRNVVKDLVYYITPMSPL